MKLIMLLLTALFGTSIAYGETLVTPNTVDSVTINNGSVFFLGNDLGNPPFTLAIYDDSLHVNGYAIGMRKSQELDIADRTPGKPDSLDAAAYVYATTLRAQHGMTQRQLVTMMAAFYRQSPAVAWVHPGDVDPDNVVVVLRIGNAQYPIHYPFPLLVKPHWWPTAEERLAERRQKLMDYADCLEKGGILIISDGGGVLALVSYQGVQLAEKVRGTISRGVSAFDAINEECRLDTRFAEEFAHPRPLPGR